MKGNNTEPALILPDFILIKLILSNCITKYYSANYVYPVVMVFIMFKLQFLWRWIWELNVHVGLRLKLWDLAVPMFRTKPTLNPSYAIFFLLHLTTGLIPSAKEDSNEVVPSYLSFEVVLRVFVFSLDLFNIFINTIMSNTLILIHFKIDLEPDILMISTYNTYVYIFSSTQLVFLGKNVWSDCVCRTHSSDNMYTWF